MQPPQSQPVALVPSDPSVDSRRVAGCASWTTPSWTSCTREVAEKNSQREVPDDILERVLDQVDAKENGVEVETQPCYEIKTFLLAGRAPPLRCSRGPSDELVNNAAAMGRVKSEADRVFGLAEARRAPLARLTGEPRILRRGAEGDSEAVLGGARGDSGGG